MCKGTAPNTSLVGTLNLFHNSMKLVLLLFPVKRRETEAQKGSEIDPRPHGYKVAEFCCSRLCSSPESTLSSAEVKRGPKAHERGSSPQGVWLPCFPWWTMLGKEAQKEEDTEVVVSKPKCTHHKLHSFP